MLKSDTVGNDVEERVATRLFTYCLPAKRADAEMRLVFAEIR